MLIKVKRLETGGYFSFLPHLVEKGYVFLGKHENGDERGVFPLKKRSWSIMIMEVVGNESNQEKLLPTCTNVMAGCQNSITQENKHEAVCL